MDEIFERYQKAINHLAKLKPDVYTPRLVSANIKAATAMSDREMEYFVLSTEQRLAKALLAREKGQEGG